MTIPDERLMAYVDGELDAEARAEVVAALATDPALAARVAAAVQLRARLSAAFGPTLTEPVTDRLIEAVRPAVTAWSWPHWGALAASLAIGLVLGPLLLSPPSSITMRAGQLVAQGPLAAALDSQLASDQSGSEDSFIGISFRAVTGEYCRTFNLRGGDALAGLACRRDDGWRIEAVVPAEHTGGGSTRTAGSGLPPEIAARVEARITGEPLDAAQETAAMEHGWATAE